MSILSVLVAVGMIPSLPKLVQMGPPDVLNVLLDGRIVGYVSSSEVEKVVAHLRQLKVTSSHVVRSCPFFFYSVSSVVFSHHYCFSDVFQIPEDLEVGYVPLSICGAYPGLFLFTSPSRFIRPVKNLSISTEENHNIEFIGPFEQVIRYFRPVRNNLFGSNVIFVPILLQGKKLTHYFFKNRYLWK